MGRRARGHVRVVAVVVRPCDWKSTPAAGFKLLPEDGREVTRWRSADDAFLNVAQGIRRVVASVRKDMATGLAKPAPRKRPVPKPVAKRAAKPGPKTGIARDRERTIAKARPKPTRGRKS